MYSIFRVLKLSPKKVGCADGSTFGSCNVVQGGGHIAASGRAGGADRWWFCADGSTQPARKDTGRGCCTFNGLVIGVKQGLDAGAWSGPLDLFANA